MKNKFHLYICEHFKADTLAVLSAGDFDDVVPTFFPSRCGRPMPVKNQLSSLHLFNKGEDDDKLFCSCSCISEPDKAFLDNEHIKQLYLINCFQMFAPEKLINQLINEGAYIMTPDWLTKWKVWVKQWGEKEHVRQMFAESVTKLVLLDTGIDLMADTNLKNLSEYLARPAETIKIGLDYYHLYLENQILKWRVSDRNKVAAKLAKEVSSDESDYAMALDLFTNLPHTEEEDVAVRSIMEIFVMMFAAHKISYLSIIDSKPGKLWTIPPDAEKNETKKRLSEPSQSMRLTESGNGFCFNIGRNDEIIAVIEVDNIAFPENLVKYQNLALLISGVFALYIDNTRNLQNIMKMNDTLRNLNATKDKLFSIIAHDLRSPFNSILGFSELLIKNIKNMDVAKSQKYLEIVNASAKDTLVLLNNLLSWAKSQTAQINFNPQKIIVSSIINKIIELANTSAIAKDISIIYKPSDEIEVWADENMLETVLRNLISNAIKFTKQGGNITIVTIAQQKQVEISIADDGVGMTDEIRKNLFDISTNITSTGTANEKGSGLGLVLCKEFVEKHGGNLWVESEEGKGSNFKFTLPVDSDYE